MKGTKVNKFASYFDLHENIKDNWSLNTVKRGIDNCVCGTRIKKLFPITNKITNTSVLIGSTCIKKLGFDSAPLMCPTCKLTFLCILSDISLKTIGVSKCKKCRDKERLLNSFEFCFGKHKGSLVKDVYEVDKGYITWITIQGSGKCSGEFKKVVDFIAKFFI
jgi:hypothetical protein